MVISLSPLLECTSNLVCVTDIRLDLARWGNFPNLLIILVHFEQLNCLSGGIILVGKNSWLRGCTINFVSGWQGFFFSSHYLLNSLKFLSGEGMVWASSFQVLCFPQCLLSKAVSYFLFIQKQPRQRVEHVEFKSFIFPRGR